MFPKQIKYLRQSRALSQVQLADKLVKKQSISNWENDNIRPSVEMLEKIADFFDVSTDYLLGREEKGKGLGGVNTLDVTGLSPLQIKHIQLIVDDIRERNS